MLLSRCPSLLLLLLSLLLLLLLLGIELPQSRKVLLLRVKALLAIRRRKILVRRGSVCGHRHGQN